MHDPSGWSASKACAPGSKCSPRRCAPGSRAHGLPGRKDTVCWWCPAPAGDGIAGAVLGLGPTPDLSEPTHLDLGRSAGPAAAGTLPVRRHVQRRRRDAADAGLGIRLVPLHPLSQGAGGAAVAGRARRAPTSNTCASRARRSAKRAISSTRPPTTSGRPNSARPCSVWRCSTKPSAGSSSARNCCDRTIHSFMRWARAVRASRASSTCAGANAARRRSRWSARACASTPAASTSSLRAACCS